MADGGPMSCSEPNADRIDQIVELPEQHIPLDEIARDQATSQTLGPRFPNRVCSISSCKI